eukprot:314286-Amphidinium_carterae.3
MDRPVPGGIADPVFAMTMFMNTVFSPTSSLCTPKVLPVVFGKVDFDNHDATNCFVDVSDTHIH